MSNLDTPNKEDKQQQSSDHAMQPRCIDMPNDEPDGHYWSWVNAPRSVPNQYRECMICGRIDATEWLESRETPFNKDLKVVGGEDDIRRLLEQVESFGTDHILYSDFNKDNTWPDAPQNIQEALVYITQLIKSRDQRIALGAKRIDENTSDGYHTFKELYEYRMLYNALLFNEWANLENNPYDVHKSHTHSDGEPCFGGGWFVVVAETPEGQVANHYEDKDWDKFHIPVRTKANKWDGATPADVAARLSRLATLKHSQKEE